MYTCSVRYNIQFVGLRCTGSTADDDDDEAEVSAEVVEIIRRASIHQLGLDPSWCEYGAVYERSAQQSECTRGR